MNKCDICTHSIPTGNSNGYKCELETNVFSRRQSCEDAVSRLEKLCQREVEDKGPTKVEIINL